MRSVFSLGCNPSLMEATVSISNWVEICIGYYVFLMFYIYETQQQQIYYIT